MHAAFLIALVFATTFCAASSAVVGKPSRASFRFQPYGAHVSTAESLKEDEEGPTVDPDYVDKSYGWLQKHPEYVGPKYPVYKTEWERTRHIELQKEFPYCNPWQIRFIVAGHKMLKACTMEAKVKELEKIYPLCSHSELYRLSLDSEVKFPCMSETRLAQLTADDQAAAAAPCGSQASPCGESNDEDFGLKKVAGQLFVDEQAAAPSQPEDLYEIGMKRRPLPAGRMRG